MRAGCRPRPSGRGSPRAPLTGSPWLGQKVGVYEIRALSFGELLDTGLRIVGNHARLLFPLALVIYLPLGLLQGAANDVLPDTDLNEMVVGIIAAFIAVILFVLVTSPILMAAITYAVAETYLGRAVTIGSAVRLGMSLFLPLVGTTLIYMFIVAGVVGGGSIIAFVVAAISGQRWLVILFLPVVAYFAIRLFLSYLLVWQVMVIERDFGMSALRRSAALMKGSLLRGLGVMVIASTLAGLLSGGAALVLYPFPFAAGLFSGILQSFSVVYTSAVSVALYFDLRCRKEAFDLEHLAQLVEGRTAATGAAAG